MFPAGGTTLEQLLQLQALQNSGKSSRAVNCLQGNVLPAETFQSCSRIWLRGALACSPWGEGALPGQDKSWVLPSHHTEEAPRALQDRTLQVLLQKQRTKGTAQQTCAHDKRKIASPLLSLNEILTWCFHNTSELSIQHL